MIRASTGTVLLVWLVACTLCAATSAAASIHGTPVARLTKDAAAPSAPLTAAHARALQASNCSLGVDLATPASVSSFQCMVEAGMQFVVVRVFQSNCWLDPHAVATIHAAWSAGLVVDVYFFPSTGCDLSQEQQVHAALDHLQANQAMFNRFWIDVEAWQWWAECERNIAWLTPLLDAARARLGPQRVGFYAGKNFFSTSMCNTTRYHDAGVPLWYARWDHNASFFNFSSYGGWTTPFMKQYSASPGLCDVNTDADWRASADCGNDLRQAWEQQQHQQQQQEQQQRLPSMQPPSHKRHRRHAHSSTRPIAHVAPAAAVAVAAPNCTVGVDLATPVSASAFQCMRETRGVQFLTVRAFQSNCYVDPHTVDTIHAAWAAGLSGVDVYFFPSVGCSMEATQQLDVTLQHLKLNNASFHRLWLDVEDWEWGPASECAANEAWLLPLFQLAQQRLGVDNVGIYTTRSVWPRIICPGSTAFASARLWYAHWDGVASFADYTAPIATWTTPSMKQFTGNDHACDINLDFDVRVDGQC